MRIQINYYVDEYSKRILFDNNVIYKQGVIYIIKKRLLISDLIIYYFRDALHDWIECLI